MDCSFEKIPSAMEMRNQNYTSQKLILQTYVESKKQDIKEKLQNDFTYLKLKSRKKMNLSCLGTPT